MPRHKMALKIPLDTIPSLGFLRTIWQDLFSSFLVAVETSEKVVKSIEVQLLRVEQVGDQDRQCSEVQNIQVSEFWYAIFGT